MLSEVRLGISNVIWNKMRYQQPNSVSARPWIFDPSFAGEHGWPGWWWWRGGGGRWWIECSSWWFWIKTRLVWWELWFARRRLHHILTQTRPSFIGQPWLGTPSFVSINITLDYHDDADWRLIEVWTSVAEFRCFSLKLSFIFRLR